MGLFHEYDIRGIYGTELTEEFAYKLAKAVIKFTKAKKVVIGYDSRKGNIQLFSALAKSFTEQGINVTHAGIISRPMLNWVAWSHKYDLGIIITASHNPKEYNGFKFIHKGKLLHYENGLNKVEEILSDKKFNLKKTVKKGKIESKDFIDEYVTYLGKHLSSDFRKYNKKFPIRIVADASNGAAGEIIKKFMLFNYINFDILFADPDGTFYCHNPNPLDDNALIVLSKKVTSVHANLGFIVDPDADRIRFVDEKGTIVENNYLDCIISKDILKKNKKAVIVHDIVARKILSETIKKFHGTNIVSQVGTSHIVEHMMNNDAVFGCEMSGHRYFRVMDNLDSGMMMLVFTLNSLYNSEHAGKKFSKLWTKFDKYSDAGELNYRVEDNETKDKVLDKIYTHYKNFKKTHKVQHEYLIDGISVVTKSYWFTIRKSNTEPILRLRIEGKNKKELLKVKSHLETFIKS